MESLHTKVLSSTGVNELASLSNLLEESLNEIFIFAPDTLKFINVNKGARRNLGYSMDELRDMTPVDIKPTLSKQEFDAMIAPLEDGSKEKITFETVHKRKDGSLYDVEVHVQMLHYKTQNVFTAIILDITERKKAENELISLGNLLEESLNEIFIFAPDTLKFINANKGARRNLGYSMDELRDMTPVDIKPTLSKQEFDAMIAPLEDGSKEKITFETVHKRKDGSLYDVEVHVQMLHYKTQNVFTAIILDITERKKAENELMRSNEELEHFAYIASHDLQEPMRIVSSFSSLLEDECSDKLSGDAKKYLEYISSSSIRMQDMVSDLLEYSKANSEDIGYTEFNAQKQIDIALENLKDSIEESNAKILCCGTMPEICASPIRFCKIMQNLIGNAIKYKSSDEAPEIVVSVEEQKETWIFSVKDNGIGIKEEYLKQIFVIFKRLHNKNQYGGTGIGLAVCKKFVESFGGKIWVESEFGKGSTFLFTIPKK